MCGKALPREERDETNHAKVLDMSGSLPRDSPEKSCKNGNKGK